MGQTMVEKIVSRQVGRKVSAGEKIERLPITKLFFNDVIGPPAIEGFRANFTEVFERYGTAPRVFDPKRLYFLPDHSVPAFTVQIAEGVKLMKEFAKETGAKMYKEGDGIEHVVLIEDGQIVPWDIVLGTDSHTDTNGALGTLAFGVGTTDSLYAMATGHLYDFMVPESVKFELTGILPKGVFSKDIILHIIGVMGAGPCRRHHGAIETALGREDPGRVDEDELCRTLDDDPENAGARRLHLGRDDRNLGPHQLIEQRRLASVGRADQRNIAAASPLAFTLTAAAGVLVLRVGRGVRHARSPPAPAMRARSAAAAATSAARFDVPAADSGAKLATLAATVKRRSCAGPSIFTVS